MVVGFVLAEVFEAVQSRVALLYLVEDDEGGSWLYREAYGKRQVLQDAARILCCLEEFLELRLFLEVKVRGRLVGLRSESLEQPGLAALPDALDDKRLSVPICFPNPQSGERVSFHRAP